MTYAQAKQKLIDAGMDPADITPEAIALAGWDATSAVSEMKKVGSLPPAITTEDQARDFAALKAEAEANTPLSQVMPLVTKLIGVGMKAAL